MLTRPRPTYRYRLRRALLVPFVDVCCGFIHRNVPALAMAAVFALWAAAQDADFREQVAQAEASRDQAQAWAAGNRVRVTLEGEPGQVATMAGQVAAVVNH